MRIRSLRTVPTAIVPLPSLEQLGQVLCSVVRGGETAQVEERVSLLRGASSVATVQERDPVTSLPFDGPCDPEDLVVDRASPHRDGPVDERTKPHVAGGVANVRE